MMAASQIKKVLSHFICPLCHKFMNKPKSLPCCHTFCADCLELPDYYEDEVDDWYIICHTCRKEVKVPKRSEVISIASSVVKELVSEKKQDEEPETVCDKCSSGEPVDTCCVICNLFCCHVCGVYHTYTNEDHAPHTVALIDLLLIALQYSSTSLDPEMCEVLHLRNNVIAGRKLQYMVITKMRMVVVATGRMITSVYN